MAGIIQTLVLTPPPTKILSFSHRFSRSPSNRAAFRFNFRFSRSNSTPVRACHHSDQVDGNGNKADKHSGSLKGLDWAKPLSNFVANNFLPLALVGGVTLGFAYPSLGCLADSYSLSKFSTFGIFIISGLTLHTGEIIAAADAWPVGIFGLVSILLFTPYFSRVILQLQLQPQEFVRGLAIFCCMPTTLSSGVALTQLAGANSALALAMTVISNLLGILIVPFSVSKFIADGAGLSVPTKQLFISLFLTLLIPLILGKIFRESFEGVADFVDQNRKKLSKISAILLSLVPWMQVSRSRSLLLMVKPAVFLGAVGMGVLLHLILLAFNAVAVKSLSALSGGSQSVFSKKENANAVLLVASQKTLPVMVAVVDQLGGALGESGLLVLPCVAAHLNQIILDSILVNYWLGKDLPTNNAKIKVGVLLQSMRILGISYLFNKRKVYKNHQMKQP
ncbi:probable sodium/metabolite cotransporter BASS4, chloroplastic isoform X2 [Rosa chinensis]|uniref:probable sodium/metabolite cotransporter BASS4, chloroplastic isoform X2 n=1 Tax=Rosa chinensis TaxID=74649 RepID=UPI001AD92E5B|nr:probable sodium/metabolite cotransporter BASS4, chloroplastic isoform X2 [Rosa chinensis]